MKNLNLRLILGIIFEIFIINRIINGKQNYFIMFLLYYSILLKKIQELYLMTI